VGSLLPFRVFVTRIPYRCTPAPRQISAENCVFLLWLRPGCPDRQRPARGRGGDWQKGYPWV